jgi:thiosulfate/3-mercaptopyruvate sulfurtransferase
LNQFSILLPLGLEWTRRRGEQHESDFRCRAGVLNMKGTTNGDSTFHFQKILVSAVALLLLGVAAPWMLLQASRSAAARSLEPLPPSDPWTPAQIVQPADLVKELSGAPSNRPIIVCVGFHTLYQGAHVPGAVFHGAAMSEQGLDDLKKWAKDLPASSNIVVYCGCCPLDHCPNLRPGFTALRDMGFHHLRVLNLPNSFAADWVEKGYPVEKGR